MNKEKLFSLKNLWNNDENGQNDGDDEVHPKKPTQKYEIG